MGVQSMILENYFREITQSMKKLHLENIVLYNTTRGSRPAVLDVFNFFFIGDELRQIYHLAEVSPYYSTQYKRGK